MGIIVPVVSPTEIVIAHLRLSEEETEETIETVTDRLPLLIPGSK